MSQHNSPTQSLNDYFHNSANELTLDKEPIEEICLALSVAKDNLTREEIVFSLIKKLELETDEKKADYYRKAIEIAIKGHPET